MSSLVALVVGVLATQLYVARDDGERELERRLEERVDLAGDYVDALFDDVAARQRRFAEEELAGRNPDRAGFDAAVVSFGFTAAVLLDGDGRVLQVFPARDDLIGTEIASSYAHLSGALQGEARRSDIVLSAAESEAIVAVAVPYETPHGRRVISGGYQLSGGPLPKFLDSVSALPGRQIYLIDAVGDIISTNQAARERHHLPGALADLPAGGSRVEVGGTELFAVSVPVPNSSWKLIVTVPRTTLVQPASMQRRLTIASLVVAIGLAAIVLLLQARLYRQRDQFARLSHTDGLTELPNRRAAETAMAGMSAAARRYRQPWSLAVIDIDRFKAINDSRGHDGGDIVLRDVAATLRRHCRETDLVARWGGEEFVVAMPQTDSAAAGALAERLRAAVSAFTRDSDSPVTVSIGVTSTQLASVADLVTQADTALYAAKQQGRDRVIVADDPAIGDVTDRPLASVGG